MVQISSQEAITGRSIGYTFNLNVNVLFCIHYGVKKAFKLELKFVVELDKCTYEY